MHHARNPSDRPANNGYVSSPRTPSSNFVTSSNVSTDDSVKKNLPDEDVSYNHAPDNIDQISQDIDNFTGSLSSVDDKSNPPEVPDTVETFARIVESRLENNSCQTRTKMTEEDVFFIKNVMRLSKLSNALSEFPSGSSTSSSLDRISSVLQRAMAFMEEELRNLLEDSNSKSHQDNSDHCALPEAGSIGEDSFPGYSSEVVRKMNRIATAMISAGYETECCQVYSISRKIAFSEQMKMLDFEKINMEDAHKMSWESLEGEVARWINVVKACSKSLFPGERKLCEVVFADYRLISRSLFSNLARSFVIQLLDFTEAVGMTKRSAEKLFKFLDMYETLRDLVPSISESCSDDCEHELRSEISASGDRIGEAAVGMFSDLENSIKNDASRTPVPGGAVHPLTRYVLNYLKYACEYKATLEQIFQQHAKQEPPPSPSQTPSPRIDSESDSPHNFDTAASTTPFATQLVKIMDLLDKNLEGKSTLYKDLSLRYIFLMNNGRYILQKVKGSTEIHQVMGDTWCRRRSTVVRQFHKNYQRETWGKVLQCLGHEGLQVNGKVVKPVLKERFKSFSMMFDEIHRTQSTWVVSDEQLQSELRVSISAVVIPAYRSFLGRFKQHLDGARQAEKYIKYQPDDIETLIEGLFDGNPTSMARRRT